MTTLEGETGCTELQPASPDHDLFPVALIQYMWQWDLVQLFDFGGTGAEVRPIFGRGDKGSHVEIAGEYENRRELPDHLNLIGSNAQLLFQFA
jgi:hypothetical protein